MKTLLGTLALGALLAISSFAIAADAPDPVIGTWKLDTARSTRSNSMYKSETRIYTAVPDGIALTWERVSADGKTSVVKVTYKYDGKDYPVTGSPDFDAISGQHVDAHTVESIQKRMGKKVGTTRRTVSEDGKTLTLNVRFIMPDGKESGAVMVNDRQ
jgi:hypothetical protein